MSDRTLLVDGNNIAFGVWAAIGPDSALMNKAEERTTILFGMLRVFQSFIEQHKITQTIICWDVGGGSKYRKKIFPYYKANRVYDDLTAYFEEVDAVRKYFKYFGIKQMICKGIEADDVIGWLSHIYKKTSQVVIFSNDKDYYQLCTGDTIQWRPCMKKMYYEELIRSETGLWGIEHVRLQAFLGQAKDNIPGSCDLDENGIMKKYGFGVKKAEKLDLTKKMKDIYADLESGDVELSDKFVSQLIRNKDQVKLSYLLSRIRTRDGQYSASELANLKSAHEEIQNIKPVSSQAVRTVIKHLEFHSIEVTRVLNAFGVEYK